MGKELLHVTLSKEAAWFSVPKKIYLHYQAESSHIENQLITYLNNGTCKVLSYTEDFFESTNKEKTIKHITNSKFLFGPNGSDENLEGYWVINTKISTESMDGVLLKKEKILTYTDEQEPLVRFNVLGFEVAHNCNHTTTYDIVFLNNWHKQYLIVCCEKFAADTQEAYKRSVYKYVKSANAVPCNEKYSQFLKHMNGSNNEVNKFTPSLSLVNALISSVGCEHKLEMEQVECLISLCQQISLRNREDLLHVTNMLYSHNYPSNLFSILKDEAWSDSHDSVQIFKSWAFFPFQKLTQPFVTLQLEFVSESPYLYNYLLSAKYGNLLAQQNLSQIFKYENADLQNLAREYNVKDISYENMKIQKYPFNLLDPLQSDLSLIKSDPRVWCCYPMSPLIMFKFEDFKNFLFAIDWYQYYLFNLGFRFKEMEEEISHRLQELNPALYYHFKRQTTNNMAKRIKYSKLAISNDGIFEDVNLILVSKNVKEIEHWKVVVNLLGGQKDY